MSKEIFFYESEKKTLIKNLTKFYQKAMLVRAEAGVEEAVEHLYNSNHSFLYDDVITINIPVKISVMALKGLI